MEVLLENEAFPRLIEEYMGQDARRLYDEILKWHETINYDLGYADGCGDGYDDGYDDGYKNGAENGQGR